MLFGILYRLNLVFWLKLIEYDGIILTVLLLWVQVVWMKDGRELKLGKKYESVCSDCTRLLMVHNMTEEDVGTYECVCDGDRMPLQLALKGNAWKAEGS